MIYFFADDHYSVSPGKIICKNFPDEVLKKTFFSENDWTKLESGDWIGDCELLILHMIGATCGQPHPGHNAETAVKKWCENGGSILLLHGSSAAFWQWQWWRKIVGFRWVRPGDPDRVNPSKHPVKPYFVRLCKTGHALTKTLKPLSLPMDEIYTELEQVSPCTILMDTKIEDDVYPQCFETISPWGGKIVSFLPGHDPQTTSLPEVNENILAIVQYLTEE